MFSVFVPGVGQCDLEFGYSEDEKGRRVTSAKLISVDGTVGFTGEATCSLEDQFVKATGRKLALTNLLDGFDRGFRTQVWAEYWSRVSR